MKVKKKSADGCARTKANGVVSASLRVARPAMNREPRKSVEPVATGSCKKRPLCESGVRMVKLRCDDQLRTTKKVPQNLNCVKIAGLSTAKLHKKHSSVRETHMNMNDHRGSHFLGRGLTYLQEPIMESSVLRTRKRTSRLRSSSPDVENTTGTCTKVSTTGKVGGSKEFFQERPSKLLKKLQETGFITRSSSIMIQKLIAHIASEFSIKNLGKLHFFLGIEVIWHNGSVHFSQKQYIKDLLARASMHNSKHVNTPAVANTNLSKCSGTKFEDGTLYHSIVGVL